MKTLPLSKSIEDLEKKLQLQGIETLYKYKGQTLEKQGVSFKIGEYSFKGSKIDRQFSLGNLQKALAINQHQADKLKYHSPSNPHSSRSNIESEFEENNNDKLNAKLENVIDILLEPKEDSMEVPYELLKESQLKKKKSQNQRRALRH